MLLKNFAIRLRYPGRTRRFVEIREKGFKSGPSAMSDSHFIDSVLGRGLYANIDDTYIPPCSPPRPPLSTTRHLQPPSRSQHPAPSPDTSSATSLHRQSSSRPPVHHSSGVSSFLPPNPANSISHSRHINQLSDSSTSALGNSRAGGAQSYPCSVWYVMFP